MSSALNPEPVFFGWFVEKQECEIIQRSCQVKGEKERMYYKGWQEEDLGVLFRNACYVFESLFFFFSNVNPHVWFKEVEGEKKRKQKS